MQVICLEEDAFFALVEQVVERLKEKSDKPQDRWIDGHEAMKMLRISSSTSLQKLRDEGKIRYSQPSRKIIVYDRESIEIYLEKNARETF